MQESRLAGFDGNTPITPVGSYLFDFPQAPEVEK